mmetsp:Transcript_46443/g.104376  ORF Transcript_46443/g.104376 Transcript_46443/m.104376 type:complete len:209 (-) Transcript_46443:1944-2570(-)
MRGIDLRVEPAVLEARGHADDLLELDGIKHHQLSHSRQWRHAAAAVIPHQPDGHLAEVLVLREDGRVLFVPAKEVVQLSMDQKVHPVAPLFVLEELLRGLHRLLKHAVVAHAVRPRRVRVEELNKKAVPQEDWHVDLDVEVPPQRLGHGLDALDVRLVHAYSLSAHPLPVEVHDAVAELQAKVVGNDVLPHLLLLSEDLLVLVTKLGH